MTDFPARGQQAPAYWDTQLKAYIDEKVTPETVEANLPERLSESSLSDTIGAEVEAYAEPRHVPPTTAAAQGFYDTRLAVYNLKPSHTRQLRAGLGRARGGSGFANIAAIGDSTVAGQGAVSGTASWPVQLVNALVAAGYPSAGSGLVAGYAGATTDSRWTTTSGWQGMSGWSSLMYNNTTTTPLTFASVSTGTSVRVYYSNGGGAFTVSIDGGAPVTVTPAGGNTLGTYVVTGLSDTTHTVAISRVSGGVQIFGVEIRKASSGVRLYNAGIGGMKVNTTPQWFTTETFAASSPNGFDADVVFVMLETNDTGSTTPADYKTRLQATITAIKNGGADVVLMTAVPSNLKDFSTYTPVLYELADTNDVPLIDLLDLMGTFAQTNAQGLMADNLHPSAAGYAVVARAVYNALGL